MTVVVIVGNNDVGIVGRVVILPVVVGPVVEILPVVIGVVVEPDVVGV